MDVEEQHKGVKIEQRIVVLQYNIDAARREQQDSRPVEERVERLFFQNRVPGILKTIVDSDANIVTLQELRNLDSSPIKMNDFVSLVKSQTGLEMIGPYFYDKTANSFALATLYDRKSFHVINMGLISLYDNEQEGDKICLWVRFHCVANGNQFIIANTHFDVAPEERKTHAIKKLFPKLRALAYEDGVECGLIVNGDFNLFDDLEGTKQRESILNYGVQDMLYPLFIGRKETDDVLSGTFIGYKETDSFCKTPETMSRLDHGFMFLPSGQLRAYGHAYTVNVTKENLSTSELPSDHLPCVREYIL